MSIILHFGLLKPAATVRVYVVVIRCSKSPFPPSTLSPPFSRLSTLIVQKKDCEALASQSFYLYIALPYFGFADKKVQPS
jgi:hypothetical protein